MSNQPLPLFPLEVVLFPEMVVPLHIFEPRYKLMIGRCLQEKREFGVILWRGEGVASVGCTAEIVQVVKEYEDGRKDILTVGRRRFALEEVFDEKPYWEGQVEYLKEEEPEEAPESTALLESFGRVWRLLGKREPAPLEGSGEAWLSFRLAAELPLDLNFKQELLELDSEHARQQRLAGRLQEWTQELERQERARRKAGGNGHGR
ncbi:MAG: LON peptidase substrate-binding domain-containing protein [Acidobacteria bacterium]|nr:LON peptidase substrate-binding domain-containing protein [Acidobacteriota bacterium]